MGFILDSLLIEVTILLISIVVYQYVSFLRDNAQFWKKRKVPHLPPKFILGNISDSNFKETMGETLGKMYREHKNKKVLGFWSFNSPVLVVFDMDLLKNFLVRDFSYFHDRMKFLSIKEDPLADTLFNKTGQHWRNLRVKLAPTFTSGKMKMMFPTIMQCGLDLQKFLLKKVETQPIFEMKDLMGCYATNVISSCAFGLETNCLENPDNDFRYYGKRSFEMTSFEIMRSIMIFTFPRLRKLLKLRLVSKDITDFFVDLVERTMTYRNTNNVRRNDFLQLLIELREKGKIEDVDKSEKDPTIDSGNSEKFSLNEAAAQAFVFFTAGFESSSSTISFMAYELAKHPEVQMRLKKEISDANIDSNSNIAYDVITKMQYLDWTIQETLRKYPVVPVVMRQLTKEYYFKEFDCTLPEDLMIFVPLLGISRDPDIFPNPDDFDPTRFTPEEIQKRHQFSSIPFGEGPRSCIGNRFGLLQTKIGIVSILREFSIEVCDQTPDTIEFNPKSFLLASKGGIPLRLVKDS